MTTMPNTTAPQALLEIRAHHPRARAVIGRLPAPIRHSHTTTV